jgi:hypothetical protein
MGLCLVSVAAGVLLSGVAGYSYAAEGKKSGAKPTPKKTTLSFQETVAYMKDKLGPKREALRKQGYQTPFLVVQDETKSAAGAAGKKSSSGSEQSSVRISINVASPHGLGAWVTLLEAPIYLIAESDRAKPMGMNKDSCEFADEPNTTSVYMETYPNPQLAMRKSGGFSKEDLDALLDSYEGICKKSPMSAVESDSFSSFNKMIPFSAMFDSGAEHKATQFGSSDTDATISDDAEAAVVSEEDKSIAELSKLGVKVYAPGDNAELSWRQLAGYATIKEEISDTILNYLKHPDIYDSIVTRTRERFESNRPRAILFEGPPGTGLVLSHTATTHTVTTHATKCFRLPYYILTNISRKLTSLVFILMQQDYERAPYSWGLQQAHGSPTGGSHSEQILRRKRKNTYKGM